MVDSSEEGEDLELPPEIWRLVCDCLRARHLGRPRAHEPRRAQSGAGQPRVSTTATLRRGVGGRARTGVLGVAAAKGDSIVTAVRGPHPEDSRAADGSCRAILAEHTNRVRCVCIMPDGRIVSGSRDEKLIVWAPDGSHLRMAGRGHKTSSGASPHVPEDRVASRVQGWGHTAGREHRSRAVGFSCEWHRPVPRGAAGRYVDRGWGRWLSKAFGTCRAAAYGALRRREPGQEAEKLRSRQLLFCLRSVVVAGRDTGGRSRSGT